MNLLNSIISILITAAITAQSALALDWPNLDSNDPARPVHKTIISSILGRAGENYHGGQYMNNHFVIQGEGVNEKENRELYKELPRLRRDLKQGRRIQLYHVGTTAEVKPFERNVRYGISVDGEPLPFYFSLYNRAKLNKFKPFLIPKENVAVQDAIAKPAHKENLPDHIGHGIQSGKGVPAREIERLRELHKDNPILSRAFRIIEGADLAIAHDQHTLLTTIRAHPETVNLDHMINVMRQDRDLITRAALALKTGRDPEDTYLPFLDQLHALGNQDKICGHSYKGRKGIDGAIILIREHPELLQGTIPNALKHVSGRDAINLRIALFYIARAKTHDFNPNQLTTFYKNNYFGHNPVVKDLLKGTSFFQDGYFFAPDNGYIKNADCTRPLPHDQNHAMVFTDCSGFIQQVVRQLHPENRRLQDRVMSYQLAPLYDVLANEKRGTRHGLYDLKGNRARDLNAYEKKKIEQFSETIRGLKNVFEPVINPLQNMRPGDILIERSVDGSEGHVMFIVDQDRNDPTRVTIVELTGFGKRRGYAWRNLRLSNDTNGTFHRVLRVR